MATIDTDNPNWKRDPHSKALVATDKTRAHYEDYLAKKHMLETAKANAEAQASQQEQINNLEQRVSLIDSKLDAILSLLTKGSD